MIKLSAENGWVTNDKYGIRMPWYTSDMLEVLDNMDLKRKKIFEFGGGHSTHWYRTRGAIVGGVDSNIDWADISKLKFEPYYPGYIDFINDNYSDQYFDIIVIDGDYRDDCTEFALKSLKSGGMLIIDNWMQPSVEPNIWAKTLELTKGMKSEVFAQEGHQDWHTAYWIKP